jgi:hypothetical protein
MAHSLFRPRGAAWPDTLVIPAPAYYHTSDSLLGKPLPEMSLFSRLSRRCAAVLACLYLAALPALADESVKQRTIMVIGDSQAQGLATGLHHAARGLAWAHVLNDAKAGTGLIAPATFDWPAYVPTLIKSVHPDVAVMMFGGNDRLPLQTGDGATVPFRTATWKDIYKLRVTAMVHALRAAGVQVIWVSNPIARDSNYSADMQYINAIFAEAAAAEGANYVDIWLAVSDGAGHYAGYGKTLSGSTARLRLDDGIHFTPAGYDLLGVRVMQSIGDLHLASSTH